MYLAPGLGPGPACAIAEAFGGPDRVLRASERDLAAAGLAQSTRRALARPDEQAIGAALGWLEGEGRDVLTLSDSRYPPLLRCIGDAPTILFLRGDAARLSTPLLAMVVMYQRSQQARPQAGAHDPHVLGNGVGQR